MTVDEVIASERRAIAKLEETVKTMENWKNENAKTVPLCVYAAIVCKIADAELQIQRKKHSIIGSYGLT